MSSFELVDQGEGNYSLGGDVSFATAQSILRLSEKLFADQSAIEVNLAGVSKTDSAGLALLLEWISRAASNGCDFRLADIPDKIQAIAVTAEIDELLQRSYSVSSSSASSSSSKK